MTWILAHDLGTSADKATLFDAEGRLCSSAAVAYDTALLGSRCVEQDPDAWWSAVATSSRTVLTQAHVAPSDVAALGFSGQMMGCVAVDRNGDVLRPALIWADSRATAEADAFAREAGPEHVYEVTGHRPSASYSAAKIAWLRKHEPGTYARSHCFLQAKDYLLARATGRFVTDPSDASGTNLYDLEHGHWSDELIEAAGIDRERLPEIVKSTDVVGPLRPEAARDLGLLAGTPIVAGGGDGPCAAVGAGAIRSSIAYASLGSSSWIGLCSERPLRDPARRTFTWAHLIDGLYSPTGTMQTSGLSYAWIARVLGSEGRGAALEDQAAAVPAGARGLIFLPYLLGERSPRWNPDARAAFIGLTMPHGPAELVRAVLEGVALNLRTILNCFGELTARPAAIRLIGGGALSPLFRQILASVLAVELRMADDVESASSLGAAVAAGIGVGLYDSWNIVERVRRDIAVTTPSPADVVLYHRLHELFETAYQRLEELNLELATVSGEEE